MASVLLITFAVLACSSSCSHTLGYRVLSHSCGNGMDQKPNSSGLMRMVGRIPSFREMGASRVTLFISTRKDAKLAFSIVTSHVEIMAGVKINLVKCAVWSLSGGDALPGIAELGTTSAVLLTWRGDLLTY